MCKAFYLGAFCALCTFYFVNFLDLFYPDGAMSHTAKSNLLNEIKTLKYSLPSWGILMLVQLLLISWQYYNLLITACSKDFLM